MGAGRVVTGGLAAVVRTSGGGCTLAAVLEGVVGRLADVGVPLGFAVAAGGGDGLDATPGSGLALRPHCTYGGIRPRKLRIKPTMPMTTPRIAIV